jgi:hypothetical protein
MVEGLQRARLVAVVLALVGSARAVEPPVAVSAPAAPSSPPTSVPQVRFIAAARYDYGFAKSVEVQFADGHSESLRANGGWVLSVGAAIRPTASRAFDLRATLGFKYGYIGASNGSVRYHAFPFEVLAALNLDRARLSAGACVSLLPSYEGTGAASGLDQQLKNSLGMVAQAEWVPPVRAGTASFSLGLRFALERMQLEVGGPVTDASTFGLVAGVML